MVKGQGLTCEQHRWVVVVPSAAKPVVGPVPLVAAPVQVPDTEVAVRAAVDRAPEEHRYVFPVLWDEVGMCQQAVQDIGVQN